MRSFFLVMLKIKNIKDVTIGTKDNNNDDKDYRRGMSGASSSPQIDPPVRPIL
jgi:hypothetical protein